MACLQRYHSLLSTSTAVEQRVTFLKVSTLFIYIYLKAKESKRETQTFCLLVHPKCLQWLELGQAEAQSLELSLGVS